MKYAKLAKELLKLLEADQREIREYAQLAYLNETDAKELKKRRIRLREHSRQRARRMLEILGLVKYPSIDNIGIEASEAVSVIALHSSLSSMKKVLGLFAAIQKDNPGNVHLPVIPPLEDRVLILEGRKQRFGTQWLQGEDGKPFLYPVEKFTGINRLRAEYGLEPIRHPKVVALIDPNDAPVVNIPATHNAQRGATEKELEEYSQDYLI